MEIIIDEGPVEGRVEADENGCADTQLSCGLIRRMTGYGTEGTPMSRVRTSGTKRATLASCEYFSFWPDGIVRGRPIRRRHC